MIPTFLSPQDKLTKSLTYILGNQDTVQTQICELEETVRHTEVRVGTAVATGPPQARSRKGLLYGPGPVTRPQAQEGCVGSVDVPRCG